MKPFVAVFITALLLSACDYGVEWSEGEYEVFWVDLYENRYLGLASGSGGHQVIIDSEVTEIASDNHYIVVKRVNHNSNTTEFYYLDLQKTASNRPVKEILAGPFSKQEFDANKQTLGLPDFSQTF